MENISVNIQSEIKGNPIITDGLHTLSGLINGEDYILDGVRYIKLDSDVEDYPYNLPTFKRIGPGKFEVPSNAVPMRVFTFTEEGIEDKYIGSYEIFDVLAKILSNLNKLGYKFEELSLSSIVLCPGEIKWLQFIPSTFSLKKDSTGIQDYDQLLSDLDKYDTLNDHQDLKAFFRSKYQEYYNG